MPLTCSASPPTPPLQVCYLLILTILPLFVLTCGVSSTANQ